MESDLPGLARGGPGSDHQRQEMVLFRLSLACARRKRPLNQCLVGTPTATAADTVFAVSVRT